MVTYCNKCQTEYSGKYKIHIARINSEGVTPLYKYEIALCKKCLNEMIKQIKPKI